MIPGVYQSDHGTIKLTSDTLELIDANSKGLDSLKILIGKPFQMYTLILNKNLQSINQKAIENINWLSQICDLPKANRREALLKIIEPIGQKRFQWIRKDTD